MAGPSDLQSLTSPSPTGPCKGWEILISQCTILEVLVLQAVRVDIGWALLLLHSVALGFPDVDKWTRGWFGVLSKYPHTLFAPSQLFLGFFENPSWSAYISQKRSKFLEHCLWIWLPCGVDLSGVTQPEKMELRDGTWLGLSAKWAWPDLADIWKLTGIWP